MDEDGNAEIPETDPMNQFNLFAVPPFAVPVSSVPVGRPTPAALETRPVPPPSDTRRIAHQAIAEHADRQLDQVLDFVRRQGHHGLTDQEGAVALDMQLDSFRARRCELRDRAKVVDSGGRRATTSGRAAAVWVAANIDQRDRLLQAPDLPPQAVATGTGPTRCRCGSEQWVEVALDGDRTRIDCRRCKRFLRWGRWERAPAAQAAAGISREITRPDDGLAPWERDDLQEAVP